MRKIIGTGETILDILFRGSQPTAAVPGGSAFNAVVSMSRAGLPVWFVGETGEDRIGQQIVDFLQQNGVHTEYVYRRPGGRSSVSLAYLNENNDADYLFFKQPPRPFKLSEQPDMTADDILVFGSYYAICASTRRQVLDLLQLGRKQGAILYYDLNFRSSHRHELDELTPALQENFRLSTVVRASAEDCHIMYGTHDAASVYHRHIAPFCPLFIYTDGDKPTVVCTPKDLFSIPVTPVTSVSTVGAGDNFNAGFVYGLVREKAKRDRLIHLQEEQWRQLVGYGQQFAANVCTSLNNSIDPQLGLQLRQELEKCLNE